MDRELFYEIILFAEDKGFKYHLGMLPVMPICVTSYTALAKKIFWEKRWEIIFNHEFAKAIWGDEYHFNPITYFRTLIPNWTYNLVRMVKEKDPFEYLEQEYKRIK